MASAQTEPSMDEILASIRRIISEEDDSPAEVPVRQKLETLQLREKDETEEAPKPRLRARQPEPEPEVEDEPEAEADEELAAEAYEEQSDELDDFEPLPEEPVHGAATMEPAADEHEHGEIEDDTFDDEMSAEPQAATDDTPDEETQDMPTAAQTVADVVRPRVMAEASERLSVSERSAGQAASAFGALEENMRLSAGSGRTIEDLIEAMLAPMLTAWPDENLPRIVEDKVEEEVRRISRRR